MKIRLCSRIAFTFSTFYTLKGICRRASTVAVCQQQHPSNFHDWSSHWFKNVRNPTSPVFSCSAENIKVLNDPEKFYEELKLLSSTASQRITLASLYLGNGDLEKKLVDEIHATMGSSDKVPKLNVLLEYTRGSRGSKNSRTMLLPIVQDFTNSTTVALFHTPNLRGILRRIVPERFNETINVSHLKVYLFDDTLIMSGANLSNDYFTNRQDRYIIFKDCKELCDYFDELVQTISKFSFQLAPDDSVHMRPDFPYHPYLNKKKDFNKAAGQLLTELMQKYAVNNAFSPDKIIELKDTSGISKDSTGKPKDTLVFPLLQMKTMGIQQDEEVTRNILSSAPSSTMLLLATAYFNLTDNYWESICSNNCINEIIMAHPKAMGFYKAPGMAGGIPNAYNLIASRRYKDLIERHQMNKIKFYEFHRPGMTFHGKGLWAYINNEQNSPFITLIGSPNFGKRSVYRDMEAQLAVVTVNEKLKKDLIEERDNLWSHSTLVSHETYKESDRAASWWVWYISTFMNDFF